MPFINCYGYINTGQKVCIGKKYISAVPASGKIFCIDETATGATYTFYDSNFVVMSDTKNS